MKDVKNWIVVFVVFLCGHLSAQELTVKGVTLLPADRTAIERPVTAGDDTCALVKIKVGNLAGLQFTNKNQYIGEVLYEDGIYMLYKSPVQSRMISFQHPEFAPGVIDLGEYGYKKLKGGKTYLVTMEAPVTGINRSIVVLKVQPETAVVTFNQSQAPQKQTGVYEFAVNAGTYNYSVQATDFTSKSGTITVEKGETKTLTLRLSPITHEVNVVCNVKDAHVFVDNVDYGRVGKLRLPQGNHQIRVQAEDYLDIERLETINASTQTLSYQLKKNENRIDIHATPVTIVSSSKRIYKNNKKLEGWVSGKPVMFMPGKYMLSDDDGKEKVINVGTKPMKVVM